MGSKKRAEPQRQLTWIQQMQLNREQKGGNPESRLEPVKPQQKKQQPK